MQRLQNAIGAMAVLSAVLVGLAFRKTLAPLPAVDTDQILKDGGKYIKLNDGRILEYFEYGHEEVNSHTRILLFFHGTLLTGRIAAIMNDYAAQHNIRIISPSLPGCGLSDRLYGRNYDVWADDVMQLVHHMNIKKFAVAGWSLGGPHAAAVAANASDDVTITCVGLLGSVVDLVQLESADSAVWWVSLLKNFITAPYVWDLLVHYRMWGQVADNTERFLNRMCGIEMDDLNTNYDETTKQQILLDFRRSVSRTIIGFLDAFKIMSTPLEISPDRISDYGKRKVVIFSGSRDSVVIAEHQQWWHRKVPSAKFVVFDDSHFFPLKYYPQILDDLFANWQ